MFCLKTDTRVLEQSVNVLCSGYNGNYTFFPRLLSFLSWTIHLQCNSPYAGKWLKKACLCPGKPAFRERAENNWSLWDNPATFPSFPLHWCYFLTTLGKPIVCASPPLAPRQPLRYCSTDSATLEQTSLLKERRATFLRDSAIPHIIFKLLLLQTVQKACQKTYHVPLVLAVQSSLRHLIADPGSLLGLALYASLQAVSCHRPR